MYGSPVFAPDYSTTVLADKMCTSSNEHSIYIRCQQIWLVCEIKKPQEYKKMMI
jgi:hypothetical protein